MMSRGTEFSTSRSRINSKYRASYFSHASAALLLRYASSYLLVGCKLGKMHIADACDPLE